MKVVYLEDLAAEFDLKTQVLSFIFSGVARTLPMIGHSMGTLRLY